MTNPTTRLTLGLLLAMPMATAPAGAQGFQALEFVDETADRLVADVELGAGDDAGKRYAWADLDQDGDVDLVVVRQATLNPGVDPLPNVLLMNEAGLLVDRSAEYASASTVEGDQGFLTATSDTRAVLVDVNGDGWLDLVTATASADGLPRHVSHPRVYVNLGAPEGTWLGLRHEADRIPELHPTAGPRFVDVAAGDLTGDGRPELYFLDGDFGPETADYGDRLLVNDGNGFFADETARRLPPGFADASGTGAVQIGDLNDDSALDVIRLDRYQYDLSVAYNNPVAPGSFVQHDPAIPLGYTPYGLAVGDLNGDGLLDMVVVENDTDPYMLNTGNDESGYATFQSGYFGEFSYGEVVLADVDHDGALDAIKANRYWSGVPSCWHPAEIYRNTGDEAELFDEVGFGVDPETLDGTRDAAVFDLDGDGWRDLVLAQCDGTMVLVNHRPDVRIEHAAPLPLWATPGGVPDVEIDVTILAPAQPQVTQVMLSASVSSGPWTEISMAAGAGLHYTAALPLAGCGDVIDFYVSVTLDDGQTVTDPVSEPHRIAMASSSQIVLIDDLENSVAGWAIQLVDLEDGGWQHGVPVPTQYQGEYAAPPEDSSAGARVKCFFTENGAPGGSPWSSDVDGGPAYLITPPLVVDAEEAILRHDRWMYSSADPSHHLPDVLTVEVTDDGGVTWVPVPHQASSGTGSAWETAQFVLSPYVELPGTVRVRFGVADQPDNSICEAAIDELELELLHCVETCPSDLDGDGVTGVDDLVLLILAWGQSGSPADLDGDGVVEVDDLVALILQWGPCL